jgi:hypothetical protein
VLDGFSITLRCRHANHHYEGVREMQADLLIGQFVVEAEVFVQNSSATLIAGQASNGTRKTAS